MTKTEKAKFNALAKQLEEMTAEKKRYEEYYSNERKAKHLLEQEITSVHAALDTLPGIPCRSIKRGYSDEELTIASRLFSWVSSVAFGGRTNSTTVKVEEDN
jgi:hypothetical protein